MKNPNPDTCPDYIPEYLLEVGEYRGVTCRRHPNGGGWVDETADVEPGVRVSQNAAVRGLSRITGNVCVSGDSMVRDSDIHGGESVNGIQVVNSIVEYSTIERDDAMPRGRLSIIDGSVLVRAELANPPIIHDENLYRVTQ